MDEAYIENTLSNHGWRNQAITFRGTPASLAYTEASRVQLPERKEVISGIAQMGKDCVIVGRNADVRNIILRAVRERFGYRRRKNEKFSS